MEYSNDNLFGSEMMIYTTEDGLTKIETTFDGDTVSVAIPYGKGAELIASLGARDIAYDLKEQRELLQKLKPYTVSLYRWEREALIRRGALFEYWGGAVLALAPEFYDDGTGVVTEPLNCGLWEE